jgi:RNA polymerase sigma-70 factor, ECF subfamily
MNLSLFVNQSAGKNVSSNESGERLNYSTRTDEELALALQKGEEPAFEELVRRHQARVFAVAYRLTGNRDDALDVAQEALLKAYRKIESWAPTGGFQSWLMRLTSNQAIDHLRRRKRRQHQSLDDGSLAAGRLMATDKVGMDVARQAQAQEIEARVQAALHVLSPSQRTVFVLRHYEGMALADIAPVLGCTVGSVKVHLFRAVKKMQAELADLA